jgi:hypothetical protein
MAPVAIPSQAAPRNGGADGVETRRAGPVAGNRHGQGIVQTTNAPVRRRGGGSRSGTKISRPFGHPGSIPGVGTAPHGIGVRPGRLETGPARSGGRPHPRSGCGGDPYPDAPGTGRARNRRPCRSAPGRTRADDRARMAPRTGCDGGVAASRGVPCGRGTARRVAQRAPWQHPSGGRRPAPRPPLRG